MHTSSQPLRLQSQSMFVSASIDSKQVALRPPSAQSTSMQRSKCRWLQWRWNDHIQRRSSASSLGLMYSGLVRSNIHLSPWMETPGRVSGGWPKLMRPALPEEAPSEIRSRSMTRTSAPRSTRCQAVDSPRMPAPMTRIGGSRSAIRWFVPGGCPASPRPLPWHRTTSSSGGGCRRGSGRARGRSAG